MECQRCKNKDDTYFYNDNGVYYCRKCILFGRIDVGKKPPVLSYKTKKHRCKYHLEYALTSYQTKVVKELNAHLKNKQNTLVYATTGAGKTEIVMQSIQDYLNAGKKVCMAISRRQVVLEIAQRMKAAFPTLHVVAVCEGYTDIVDGDLIVCTMHQLHRYYQTFHLLIMDEVDAFPYKGNEVLESIAHHACIGEIVYLTATPDAQMRTQVQCGDMQMVKLFRRPHGYDLCVPTMVVVPFLLQCIYLYFFLRRHKKEGRQALVFVPTIALSERMAMVLSLFFRCCSFTSKTKDKEQIALGMREGRYDFLVATTVLERGITIPGVDIIVVQAQHVVFDEASLLQMAGRAGRSMDCPTGEVVFLASEKSKGCKDCIATIKTMNEEK